MLSIWVLQKKKIFGESYGGYEYNYKDKKTEYNEVVVPFPVLSYKIEF